MKKYILFLLPLFFIGIVSADCGITNLASCISENFFDFLMQVLNSPIQPLLNLVYNLLTEPVNIDLLAEVWAIVVYILSMFYGILLMYVGFQFILSGYSLEKREKAKSSLANTLVMIVLVQASFYLYSLMIEVTASVTTVLLNMVDKNFFLLTIDNISNVGLELVMVVPYLVGITTTLIILTLRYIIVSAGVVFFAIGIFFYFIEPLNNYGKLIINFLIASISVTLFYAIIFLASSKLLDVGAFADFKILVMIGAFTLINLATLFVALFVVIKSALKVAQPVMQVVSVVGAVAG